MYRNWDCDGKDDNKFFLNIYKKKVLKEMKLPL